MPGRRRTTRSASDPTPPEAASARAAGTMLRSYTVGALPILNDVLGRMRLEEHLQAYLPAEDGRTKPSTAKTLLVLVRNLLVSREPLYGIGELVDRISACSQPSVTKEGYRLLWYHNTRKAELDAIARDHRIQRAMRRLGELRRKLVSPRTRYRKPEKVQRAVAKILEETEAEPFIQIEIVPHEEETFHQATRGRPTASTRYVRKVRTRLQLNCNVDVARVAQAATSDGVFPLVTNVTTLSPGEVLAAYKRQPTIEKRFSQLKTDFAVAPVYLKAVHRIEALLCVYFFALVVEALVERELRGAMGRKRIESLPLYPEGRPCRRPTTRRVIDVFAGVQRHTLTYRKHRPQVLVTELSRLQRRLLRLFALNPTIYGH